MNPATTSGRDGPTDHAETLHAEQLADAGTGTDASEDSSAALKAPNGGRGKDKADTSGEGGPLLSAAERQALKHTAAILHLIKLANGRFLRDEENRLYVRWKGKTIPLDESSDNIDLDELLMTTRELPGSASPAGRYTVRYLRVHADRSTKDASLLRHFSALSKDAKRLYVSTKGGLLQISAGAIKPVNNGENEDRVVLEPADGQQPFNYAAADPEAGLSRFEELIVDVQAIVVREMAWLLVMQCVLFAFVRAAFQDRFISALLGPGQSGKSSGLRWCSVLLGFEELKGDYTPAAIRAAGDAGSFFLDNKEQRNLNSELQDLLLFMGTGGESGRSNPAGGLRKSKARPVMSLTSIEGPDKPELKSRCVNFHYALTKEQMKTFSPRLHLQRIEAERNEIMSALLKVLQRFLQMEATSDNQPESVPDGAARFQDNYRADCNMLRAFGHVAGKPAGWADGVIAGWNRQLSGVEPPNEQLDYLVRTFIQEKRAEEDRMDPLLTEPALREHDVRHKGTRGTLYVTHHSALIDWGKKRDPQSFPRSSQALSARLKEIDSPSFQVLREADVKGDAVLEKLLKRKENVRFVGFFVPDGPGAD